MDVIFEDIMDLMSRIKGSQLDVAVVREQLIELVEIVSDLAGEIAKLKEVKGNEVSGLQGRRYGV